MTKPDASSWSPCQPGEVQEFAAHLSFVRRLRTAALAGLVGVAAVGSVGGSWYVYERVVTGTSQQHDPDCSGEAQKECVGFIDDASPATAK